MKVYGNYSVLALTLAWSLSAIAGGQEASTVRAFSMDNAELIKNSLHSEQRKRFMVQAALGTVGTGVLTLAAINCYDGLKDWWQKRGSHANDASRIGVLEGQMRPLLADARGRNVVDVAPAAAPAGDAKKDDDDQKKNATALWLAEKILGWGSWAKWAALALAGRYAWGQADAITNHILPNISDYFFKGRTLAWFIENRTKRAFVVNIQDMSKWLDEVEARTGEINLLERVKERKNVLKFNYFTQEIEKIIGYMLFVFDNLKDDQETEKIMARQFMDTVIEQRDKIATAVNEFMKGSLKDRAALVATIRESMIEIIKNLQAFVMVHTSAGFDDLDISPLYEQMAFLFHAEHKPLKKQLEELQLQNVKFKAKLADLRNTVLEAAEAS